MGALTGYKCIHKNGKEIRVPLNQVNELLKNGWKLGHTEESKRKNSESHKGKTSPFKGKHHSEEAKKKNSESKKGEKNPMYGKTTWMKGKTHTEKTKKKSSESHLGLPSPMKGKYHSEEARQKMRKPKSNEGRKNMRLAAIKRIEENNGKIFPNFNKNSIVFFEKFDKDNNTSGFYGKEEFHIKKLGYWLDYFNPDLKLIIEWDEETHYRNDKLKKKDIQRQKNIQEFYPDFEFRRIREKDIIEI